jgi:uncharacterized phage protein (TIGR01671 family)
MAIREIEFRGKRIDNGEYMPGSYGDWVYGSYGLKLNVATGEHDEYIMESVYNGATNSSYFVDYKIIPGTAGQYTGIADTNGNKIFEGDVVVCQGGEYYHGIWEYEGTEIVKDIRSIGFLEYCEKAIVIGNIHDKEE